MRMEELVEVINDGKTQKEQFIAASMCVLQHWFKGSPTWAYGIDKLYVFDAECISENTS